MRPVLCILLLVSSLGGSAEEYFASDSGLDCTTKECRCAQEAPCRLQPRLIEGLRPGDVLRVAPGSYSSLKIRGLHGTPTEPVTISGLSGSVTGTAAASIDARDSPARDAVELVGSSHVVLKHLHVSGAKRAGLRINNSHHISVVGSTIESNGVWGIFSNHANDISLRKNRIVGPASQHGVYLSNSGDGGLIEENYIVGFDGCAIQLNGDLAMGGGSGVPGDGIISGVSIRNNYLAGNGRAGGSAINLDGAERTIIHSNLILDNHAASIAMYRVDGAAATKLTQITHNVIVGARDSRALIIVEEGARDQRIEANIIAGLSERAPLFAMADTLRYREPEQAAARTRLPATLLDNSYFHRGPVGFAGRRVFETVAAWNAIAGDRSSTALPLPQPQPVNDEAVYARISRRVVEMDLLKGNPWRDRLWLYSEPENSE